MERVVSGESGAKVVNDRVFRWRRAATAGTGCRRREAGAEGRRARLETLRRLANMIWDAIERRERKRGGEKKKKKKEKPKPKKPKGPLE